MLSKVTQLIIVAQIMAACADSGADPDVNNVGDPLDETTPVHTEEKLTSDDVASGEAYVFTYDEASNRILQLNMIDLSLTKAITVTDSSLDHTLLAGKDANYIIDFSKRHLEIIHESGERSDATFSFQGTPISAAFNKELGTLVMRDDVASIGIVKLEDDGRISEQWLGGPLVDGDNEISAGDLSDENTLLLSLSNGDLAIVNIDKSLAKQTWSYKTIEDPGLGTINWIAPEESGLFLCTSDTHIALVDSESRQVTSSLNLDNLGLTISKRSKYSNPHVIVYKEESNTYSLVHLNDDLELTTKGLSTITSSMELSYYSRSLDQISGMQKDGDIYRSLRARLSDGLIELNSETNISGDVDVFLGYDYILAKHSSKLGKLEKYELDPELKRSLTGFNFDYLRSQ